MTQLFLREEACISVPTCEVELPSVCYEYVLLPLVNKKLLLSSSLTEYSQTEKDIYREKGESVRCRVATEETDTGTLHGKTQPHSNSQIDRNGLI